MANLIVTAANVVQGANARVASGVAGVAVTAGETAYLDPADNKYKKCDADSSVVTAECKGIFLNSAAANQPVDVQYGGRINPGAAVTVGEIYVASPTAGGIAPVADLATGDFVSIIGIGVSASLIELGIHNSGVQVPA